MSGFKAALETLPDKTQTRLVVTNVRQQHLAPDLIDTLGVIYDVEPQFFLSIAAEHDQYREHDTEGAREKIVAIPRPESSFLHLNLIQPPG